MVLLTPVFISQAKDLEGPGPSPSLQLLQLSSCSSHMECEAQHSQPGLTSIPVPTHPLLWKTPDFIYFHCSHTSDRLVKPHLSSPLCLQGSQLSLKLPVPSSTSLPAHPGMSLLLQSLPTTSQSTLSFSLTLLAMPVLGCWAHLIHISHFWSHL